MKDIAPENFEKAREQIHRQMLSAVSHDLKTPLATIIGSLEIFQRMGDKLSPEKKSSLMLSALGEAYRLDNFITNILDMAKLESGMVKIKNEPTDICLLLQDCITRLGPRAKNGRITLSALPCRGRLFSTDPMLLGRAVGLVLDNALKHTGKEPHITISCELTEQELVIDIQDNGPGIATDKHEAIFSKYTRLSRNDQQNAGTGLGLSICRQIMLLLSGSVEVHNHSAGGAVFRLRAPAAA